MKSVLNTLVNPRRLRPSSTHHAVELEAATDASAGTVWPTLHLRRVAGFAEGVAR